MAIGTSVKVDYDTSYKNSHYTSRVFVANFNSETVNATPTNPWATADSNHRYIELKKAYPAQVLCIWERWPTTVKPSQACIYQVWGMVRTQSDQAIDGEKDLQEIWVPCHVLGNPLDYSETIAIGTIISDDGTYAYSPRHFWDTAGAEKLLVSITTVGIIAGASRLEGYVYGGSGRPFVSQYV